MNLKAEDKKKLYLLGGLAGTLGVLGVVFVILPLFRGAPADDGEVSNAVNMATANVPRATSTSTPPPNGLTMGRPVSTSAASSSSGGGSSAGGSSADQIFAPQLIGVGRPRTDPFAPEEVVPALAPTPVPTPRVEVRVTMEPLAPLVLNPYTPTYESTTVSLPSGVGPSVATGVNGTGSADSRILQTLPPAMIFGATARIAPRSLPNIGGLTVAAPGAQANIVNADDKRVAGVIIGDSIRALIEYQENGQTVSRVVQPGDNVGGMEILSIGRVSEGGQQLVRVTVRENGQEKYFDLKSR